MVTMKVNMQKERVHDQIDKTLDIYNAALTVITAGRWLPFAQFTGEIEITEYQQTMHFIPENDGNVEWSML